MTLISTCPGMIRAPGIGPVGWNEAVLDLLAQVP